jgi:hypothetical protein
MAKEEKKAPAKEYNAPVQKPTPTPVKSEAPTELRSVVSKEVQAPVAKLGLKATYAQLWQNASGKKCDPNEKDSAGSPVLEKYFRGWSNAD